MSSKRTGINAVQYIDDLIKSPSFKVAIDLYNNGEKETLRVRLIEWLREAEEATKQAFIKEFSCYKGLDRFEAIPLLKKMAKDFDMFHWYKIDNRLTEFEQKWYVAMVEGDEYKKQELLK